MKKKRQRIYRLTISLPLDLYKAMCRDMAGLNWSAIATEAFLDALRLRGEGRLPKYLTIEERLIRLERKVFSENETP